MISGDLINMIESQLNLDPVFNWKKSFHNEIVVYSVGDQGAVDHIISKCLIEVNNYEEYIKGELRKVVGNYAVIIETNSHIIAAVDHIRSYPIFYSQLNGQFIVSNSARTIDQDFPQSDYDELSFTEFCRAGYVSGRQTLKKDIYQLQAGESILWDKATSELIQNRYFKYFPVSDSTPFSESEYLAQLNETINNIFNSIINRASGSPIWIPLSGGLDSRLILCKIHELGYKNIHTFSYGPSWNYEAKRAREIAQSLNVEWVFIKHTKKNARTLFRSKDRKDYWSYSDNLSTIPIMNEYEAINYLKRTDSLSDDSIFINGQSGDFVSGGHIPFHPDGGCVSKSEIIEKIVTKHYSVTSQSVRNTMHIQQIRNKISEQLFQDSKDEYEIEQAASLYELWEWAERQAKMVVNGQRLYEYYNYRWELPLWDIRLQNYFLKLPLEYRYNQTLFKKYLKQYNYKSLFEDTMSEDRRWPPFLGLLLGIIVKLSSLIKINVGWVKKYFSYYGHYNNQYALFGLKYFLRHSRDAIIPPQGRGIIALSIKTCLAENRYRNKSIGK